MPLFVTVDGVDGVGKTTACKALAETLGAVYFKSPSAPFDQLRAQIDKTADPLTRYFFYRAATQNDSRQIEALLKSGKSVVCDRYIYSTYAYHAAMDNRLKGNLDTIGLVMPDLAILLTASEKARKQRLADRFMDQSYDKHLEKNLELQNAVAAIFKTLKLTEIDSSTNSPQQVVNLMLDVIRRKLNGR